VGRLWSELEPWEWRLRLPEWHPDLNQWMLLWVGLKDPELAPRLQMLPTRDDRIRAALRWYADEGHAQPENPVAYSLPSALALLPVPRWGAAPPLDDEGRIVSASKAGAHERPIPDPTLLEIFRLVVDEQASARRLATMTDERGDLTFVNRIKAGVIVEWIGAHEDEAKVALERQELPAQFPATSGGRLLPKP
jgi:hypothetical protein